MFFHFSLIYIAVINMSLNAVFLLVTTYMHIYETHFNINYDNEIQLYKRTEINYNAFI